MAEATSGGPGGIYDLAEHDFATRYEQFNRDGYVVFEKLLDEAALAHIRAALEPYLGPKGPSGRNDFEGLKSQRVYSLLAKSEVFDTLVTHAVPMAFAQAELGRSFLLSACLAINIHPGETVQPWHYDDAHIQAPRPRAAFGVSAFWAIDDTTTSNGATEIIPGSHQWSDESGAGEVQAESFSDRNVRATDDDPGARSDSVKVTLTAGSLMLTKGTLWHRGGANKSNASRLIITPQYCPGWARPLENMLLAISPEQAASLSKRARELIGYSIHPPFMGYVDGRHPEKVLSQIAG